MGSRLSVISVSVSDEHGAAIVSHIGFKKPDGSDGQAQLRLDEFRSANAAIRKLERSGCVLPAQPNLALKMIGKLRRQTLARLKSPDKVTYLEIGREVGVEISRWLLQEAIAERWQGFVTSERAVFISRTEGRTYYLATSKLLNESFRDSRGRGLGLKFLCQHGALVVQRGRSVLTSQVWLKRPKRMRRSFYMFDAARCESLLPK